MYAKRVPEGRFTRILAVSARSDIHFIRQIACFSKLDMTGKTIFSSLPRLTQKGFHTHIWLSEAR
jgi:hypothetical protein